MFKYCVAAICAVVAVSHPAYVADIPNGKGVNGVAALGHTNPAGGGARNAFGTAFGNAKDSWTLAVCCADSDGDTFTNGFELGDECCTWTKGGTPSVTKDISHPGNKTSIPKTRKPTPAACAGGDPCAKINNLLRH